MPNGLRLSKTVNGAKTSFLWNGDQMFMEVTSSEIRSYTKLPGYMRTGTNKVMSAMTDNYYLFNGHGDVVGMTDMNGNKTKDYEYDAFGNETTTNANDTNPFRYCGEYVDNETGLIYLRNRYYDSSTGRFINEDPIRSGGNWYSYCGGNPIAFVDSLGLEKIVVSGGAYDDGDSFKYTFIEPALKKLNEFIKNDSLSNITWIIACAGWTTDDLENFCKAANYENNIFADINVIFIDSKDDLINYINNKSVIDNTYDNSDRLEDPIDKFVVYAHGLTDEINLGYHHENANDLTITKSDIDKINANAFNNPDTNNGSDHWGHSIQRIADGFSYTGSDNYPRASIDKDDYINGIKPYIVTLRRK